MYRLEPAGTAPRSIEQASALLTTVFGAKASFTAEYLRWLYAENPAGPVVGFNAFAEDALAAHYVTVPVAATLEGRAARGLLSLNTATHPGQDGWVGFFMPLQKKAQPR
mgnify:CR=1 FL=1